MSNVKQLRGQVRQIVKELLAEEMKTQLYAELQKEIKDQVSQVQKLIMQSLEQLDKNQKDFQSYLLREMQKPQQ